MNPPRIALGDNARFVAIVLVVLGHALTKTVSETDTTFVLYVTIYLFHIPLFVFLSGYFSPAEAPTVKRIQGVVVYLLIPYLIFETIWSVIQSVQAGEILFNPLRPSWTLWFLLSLAAWRILLPYLVMVPMPLVMSLVIAVSSGYWSVDQTLSLSRTLAFLPFFVLGWHAKQWGIDTFWLSRFRSTVAFGRMATGAWFAGLLAVVWWERDLVRASGIRKLLTADTSYAQAGFDLWFAGGIRLALFLMATIMIVAFLALMPRRQLWISALGAGTMSVYLIHSFVLAPLRQTPILQGEITGWHLVAIIVGSVMLTILLAHPMVRRVLGPLIQPRWVLSRKTASY